MFIKGFDKDLKCRGYQFAIGEVYDTGYTENLSCCSKTVFHFCENLKDVHEYYRASDENNRFCEIEVLGELVREGNKCGSNKIKIIREIVGEELNLLKMLTNGNTGVFNPGNCNTGDCNPGNCNTGDCNPGNWNPGNYNPGNYNPGNYNPGNWNPGNCNTGDCNTGDWNTTDFETGFFNTKQGRVRIFNKTSNLTSREFRDKYNRLFDEFVLTEWVYYTDKEKENRIIRQCLGGYLKQYTFKEASSNWYKKLNVSEKELLFTIPNFDCDIFEEITGLDVREDFKKYGPNTKEK